MKRSVLKFPYVVLLLFVLYFAFIGFDALHSTGYVGGTKKNGNGCVCHGDHSPTDSVVVWISGPDTVKLGTVAMYTMFMKGGPAIAGGFNVATSNGVLTSFDGTTQVLSSELTHTMPKNFQNDTVQWKFFYQAPISGKTDTLFSVGNSVDLNGLPTGDQYNFGTNVIVHLKDTTLGVDEGQDIWSFRLYQNYPNPFNPKTEFRFRVADFGLVSLKIYDITGREIATLVNEVKPAGTYNVSWDAGAVSSGIYIYRLTDGALTETRTMLLIR